MYNMNSLYIGIMSVAGNKFCSNGLSFIVISLCNFLPLTMLTMVDHKYMVNHGQNHSKIVRSWICNVINNIEI